jgi:hypothetical protein
VRYFGPGTWSPTLYLEALLNSTTSSLSSANRFGKPVHIGMHVGASGAVCFGEATRVPTSLVVAVAESVLRWDHL